MVCETLILKSLLKISESVGWIYDRNYKERNLTLCSNKESSVHTWQINSAGTLISLTITA